jgi:hypothetical protein
LIIMGYMIMNVSFEALTEVRFIKLLEYTVSALKFK